MTKLGHKISLFPIGQIQPAYDEFIPALQQGLENAKMFDPKAISLRKYHQFDMAQHVGMPKVGFTVFELNRLKDQELHHLSTLDLVISPTEWQKDIISKSIKESKNVVVELGVDTNVFKPYNMEKANRPFTLLCVGKWEERKNYENILKCFDRAFSPHHDVEIFLICHCLMPEIQKNIERQLAQTLSNMALAHKVKILPPNFMALEQLVKIYNLADCYISYARAEGFSLPNMEAMACGKPIIATYCTGPTQYLDNEEGVCKHGWLIKPTRLIPANDGVFFDGFGEWCDFNNDHLIEAMRYAYQNWKGVTNSYNVNRAAQFTWENTAKKLTEVLTNL